MKKVLICAFVALLTLGSCQTVKLAKEIVLPVTTKTVSGQSQDFKMKVTADGKWDLAVDKTAAEWLSVTPETGNEGETVITVSVKSNLESESNRTGKINILAGELSKNITINQKGLLSVIDKQNVTVSEREDRFVISSMKAWEITLTDTKSTPDWFTVEPSSGTGGAPVEVVVKKAQPNYDEMRTAFIKINFGEEAAYVTAAQAHEDAFILSIDHIDIPSEGGLFKVDLASTQDIKSIKLPSWIKEAEAPTKALTDYEIYFEAEPSTTDDRSGEIVFTTTNAMSGTVDVFQVAPDMIIFNKSDVNIGATGGSFELTMRTNVEYAITISDGWIHQVETKSVRVDKVSFNVDVNYGEKRVATITAKDVNSDLSASVKVTQSASASQKFLEKTVPGIYKGSNASSAWTHKDTEQWSTFYGNDNSFIFRIIDPFNFSVLELTGLPVGFEVEKDYQIGLQQDFASGIAESLLVRVLKKEDGKCWMWNADNNIGIISLY